MRFDVNWTKEAEITFNKNIKYLSTSWNLLTIINFLDRVDDTVETLRATPELYPLHRKKDNVHKCVLNKHVTLYYMIVSKSRVDLLSFWNTHQDPDSLKV